MRKQAIRSATQAGLPPPAKKKPSIPPHVRTRTLRETVIGVEIEEMVAAPAQQVTIHKVFDILFSKSYTSNGLIGINRR
jgi:hypothetical protein